MASGGLGRLNSLRVALAPNSFVQAFEINEGKQILPSTHLVINSNDLVVEKDFFPFIFSGEGSAETYASPALLEKDMPWFWDIKETIEKNKNNPHFDLQGAVKEKAAEYAGKGASEVFVYKTAPENDDLKFEGKEKTEALKRERQLKSWKSREKIQQLIQNDELVVAFTKLNP